MCVYLHTVNSFQYVQRQSKTRTCNRRTTTWGKERIHRPQQCTSSALVARKLYFRFCFCCEHVDSPFFRKDTHTLGYSACTVGRIK